MELRQVTEIASGVDALYLSGRAKVKGSVLHELLELKADAACSGDSQPWAAGETTFNVASHNWSKWPILLEHEHGRIGLTGSEHLPTLRVQPYAPFLHGVGPAEVVPWLDRQFSPALGDIQWSLSRLDLYVDVTGWTLDANDRERFACRATRRNTHEKGGVLTGFEFGTRNAPIFGRLYDKTAEIAYSNKAWWHEIWGPRWSGEQVWRFEAQINREGLRQYKIETPDEGLAKRGDVWANVTDEWITYRDPSADSNKSRWPIAPEWEAVQRASLRAEAVGLKRITKAKRSASLARLAPATRGYLAAVGALLGARTYDETMERLRLPLARVGARSGITFEELLARRAAELGIAR